MDAPHYFMIKICKNITINFLTKATLGDVFDDIYIPTCKGIKIIQEGTKYKISEDLQENS